MCTIYSKPMKSGDNLVPRGQRTFLMRALSRVDGWATRKATIAMCLQLRWTTKSEDMSWSSLKKNGLCQTFLLMKQHIMISSVVLLQLYLRLRDIIVMIHHKMILLAMPLQSLLRLQDIMIMIHYMIISLAISKIKLATVVEGDHSQGRP